MTKIVVIGILLIRYGARREIVEITLYSLQDLMLQFLSPEHPISRKLDLASYRQS
jgi:hypothetical protein